MKALAVLISIVLVCAAQVTIAPLFPLLSAEASFLVVTLAILVVFAGPRTALIATPLMAVFLGFASDRSPALLLLSLLPLPPLAYWLSESQIPMSRGVQLFAVVAVVGAWSRGLLALSAVAQGAEAEFGTLITDFLLPGIVIDGLFFTLAYVPCRLLGLEPRSLSPYRERYQV
jgi:hypothetical protein